MFGVPTGKLLRYFICTRGIEVSPEKTQAILTMEQPTKLRGVQQLLGRVATLSRFISKLGEKVMPFYKLLRKSDKLEWMSKVRKKARITGCNDLSITSARSSPPPSVVPALPEAGI
jgi:hypothetical protein